MKISLIGMSGSGKSYWAKQLESKGFQLFCIDDLIEERLGGELRRHGFSGINEVARWMGQPYDARYAETSARYLALEEAVLRNVLNIIAKDPTSKDLVIDTTGSVIYIHDDLLRQLADVSTVVYLQLSPKQQAALYQQYVADPKPVIWGDTFSRSKDETPLQALAQSYPKLLAARIKRYEELAAYVLPLGEPLSDQDFMRHLKNAHE